MFKSMLLAGTIAFGLPAGAMPTGTYRFHWTSFDGPTEGHPPVGQLDGLVLRLDPGGATGTSGFDLALTTVITGDLAWELSLSGLTSTVLFTPIIGGSGYAFDLAFDGTTECGSGAWLNGCTGTGEFFPQDSPQAAFETLIPEAASWGLLASVLVVLVLVFFPRRLFL